MVLESLTNPFSAEAHPAWLIPLGALYAVAGLWFGFHFFPQNAGVAMVFFITAAGIPLMYNLMNYEEEKDLAGGSERSLLKEHSRAVNAYFMLFIGITLALALAYLVLPGEHVNSLFDAQMNTYKAINPHHVVGKATDVTGNASAATFFSIIFLNNIRVLAFALFLSLLYGAGAILILAWNASVLGLAIGNTIRLKLAAAAAATGLTSMASYLTIPFHVVFLRYGIHAALEIAAYIVAGLAGGILSAALIKHHWQSKRFENIIVDTADLVLISIALLVLGAGWEAFITPAFY